VLSPDADIDSRASDAVALLDRANPDVQVL